MTLFLVRVDDIIGLKCQYKPHSLSPPPTPVLFSAGGHKYAENHIFMQNKPVLVSLAVS